MLPFRLEVLAHRRSEIGARGNGRFGVRGRLGHGVEAIGTDEDEYTIPGTKLPTVLILSLDTTTRGGSAAVLRGDTPLAVVEGDASRTHGERLPGELDAALTQAGVALADVALLAVARGPGAFTGLRIGLAAMQGAAMVTGRPVVGVSALDALAAAAFAQMGAAEAAIGVWMDAARGEVFASAYRASGDPGGMPTLSALTSPEVGSPEAVWSRWAYLSVSGWCFIGDGASRYRAVLGEIPQLAAPPLAPFIGRLAWRQAGEGGHLPHDLQPLYVRRPDAERGQGT
jgi:tRNA threonylcarbamoyladenosine biosynthesis protein TsaB